MTTGLCEVVFYMSKFGQNQLCSSECINLVNTTVTGVQICTLSSWSICTLGIEHTKLYTLDWEEGVQICTLMRASF